MVPKVCRLMAEDGGGFLKSGVELLFFTINFTASCFGPFLVPHADAIGSLDEVWSFAAVHDELVDARRKIAAALNIIHKTRLRHAVAIEIRDVDGRYESIATIAGVFSPVMEVPEKGNIASGCFHILIREQLLYDIFMGSKFGIAGDELGYD